MHTLLTLNDVETKICETHELTDEMIDFLSELDNMNSKTTKAWLIRVIGQAYNIAKKHGIAYQTCIWDERKVEELLKGKVSDYILNQAFERRKK